MTPGTVCSTTHGSRDEGMFWSSSIDTLVDVVVFFVSTTGDSAVTVTWVATPAIPIEMRSGTLAPVPTCTFLLR